MLQAHGCLITPEKIAEVEIQYPLNDYTQVIFSIGPQFVEPFDDGAPSDLEVNKSDMEEEDAEAADDSSEDED